MNLQVADLGSAPIASLGGYVPAAKDNNGAEQLIQAFLGGALGSIGSELGQNIMANDVSAEAAKQGLGPGEQGAFKRWFSPYTRADLKADRSAANEDMTLALARSRDLNEGKYRNESLGLQRQQLEETAKDRAARLALEEKQLAQQASRWEDEFGDKRAESLKAKQAADARLGAESAARNRALGLQEKELNLKTSIALGYGRDEIDMETGLPKVKAAVSPAAPSGKSPEAAMAELNAAKQPEPLSRGGQLFSDIVQTPRQMLRDVYNQPGPISGVSLKDVRDWAFSPARPDLRPTPVVPVEYQPTPVVPVLSPEQQAALDEMIRSSTPVVPVQ